MNTVRIVAGLMLVGAGFACLRRALSQSHHDALILESPPEVDSAFWGSGCGSVVTFHSDVDHNGMCWKVVRASVTKSKVILHLVQQKQRSNVGCVTQYIVTEDRKCLPDKVKVVVAVQ